MSNTIQIKRSSTAAAVPTAGQLAVGELAVNLVDKKLYTKDAVGAVVELTPDIKSVLNAPGDAPVYACRAWVNFNGTGTVAIRASGNVSSIVDNGVGNYTVNFTTAMPDADYAITGSGGAGAASNQLSFIGPYSANPTPSAVRLVSLSDASIVQDTIFCSVAIFR